MAKLKGEFQADNGDILYPHTSSDVVFMSDGKTVEQQVLALFQETLNIGKGKNLLWKDGGSCNDFLFGEWYCTPKVTETPVASHTYYLVCKYVSNDYVAQLCIDQENGDMYIRVKQAGIWKSWREVVGDKIYTQRPMPDSNNIDDFKNVGYVNLGDTINMGGTFPPYKTSFSWGKLTFDGIHQTLETQNQTPTAPEALGKTFKRTYYTVQGKWGSWEQIPQINHVMMKRSLVQEVDLVSYFKNIALPPGIYYINKNCTNKPPIDTFYIATFERSPVGADWKLTLSSFSPQNRIFTADCWNGVFSGWKEVATTSKTTISLLNGWTVAFGNPEVTRSGSICFVSIQAKVGLNASGTTIFNVPQEYRPKYQQTFFIPQRDNKPFYAVVIESTGDVRVVHGLSSLPTTGTGTDFYMMWRID